MGPERFHHRAQQKRSPAAIRRGFQKASVHLHILQRQRHHAGEIGISGAEIVQIKFHAPGGPKPPSRHAHAGYLRPTRAPLIPASAEWAPSRGAPAYPAHDVPHPVQETAGPKNSQRPRIHQLAVCTEKRAHLFQHHPVQRNDKVHLLGHGHHIRRGHGLPSAPHRRSKASAIQGVSASSA